MEMCVEIACSCWVVCKQAPRCFLLAVLDCLSLVSQRCGRVSLSSFNRCRILWGDPVTGIWPYLSDHLPPDVAAVGRPVWGLPAWLLWLLHRFVLHPVSSPLTLDCMRYFPPGYVQKLCLCCFVHKFSNYIKYVCLSSSIRLNVLFNLINRLQLPRNSVYCVQQEIEEMISPERRKQAHISHV